jgi:hydroxyethylthiazole kinase-like uncharacterized protein yjeF
MITRERHAGYLLSKSTRLLEAQLIDQTAPHEPMQRAAQVIARCAGSLLRTIQGQAVVTGLIGPGNNGADALLALNLLHDRGYRTRALFAADRPLLDAQPVSFSGEVCELDDLTTAATHEVQQQVVIDGLFGIGLNRPLGGAAAQAAQWTTRLSCPVLAVDVPSGLNPDTGALIGGPRAAAVRASHTVTFLADKPGLNTAIGPDHAGSVSVHRLGCEPFSSDGICIDKHWVASRMQPRKRSAHKGSFGMVAAIGGATGMNGAALLAAHGARAAGAGKVATISPDGPVFDPGHPQLMALSIDRPSDFERHLSGLSSAVIGCGLGTGSRASSLLMQTLSTDLPLVVDADGLNLIGGIDQSSALSELLARRSRVVPTVLTPHPLEAARLLSVSTAEIQSNRIHCAQTLAQRSGAIVLLKGAGSVLASPDGRWGLIGSGGPALAAGGTGDILAGLIAGLLAQQPSSWEAAAVAAWAHGDAGDHWLLANPLGRGLHSTELLQRIVHSLNDCPD